MVAWVRFILIIICYFSISAVASPASDVFNKVNKSIFLVYVFKEKDSKLEKKNLEGLGSAVAVGPNIIATNCHVASANKRIIVIVNQAPHDATLIHGNDKQDICLLELDDVTLVPVKLRPSEDLVVGEDVYAIGNPGAIENYLSKGIFSKRRFLDDKSIWILADIRTGHGSSGGGLFDDKGNLIGITTGALRDSKISFSAATDWIIQKLRIEPRYHGDPNKDNNPPQLKKYNAEEGLVNLGVFGASKVGLYKFNGSCFIHMSGKGLDGSVLSSAIWSPRFPKEILIVPAVSAAPAALAIVFSELASASQGGKAQATQNMIRLDNKRNFYLYGGRLVDGKFPILIGFFDGDVSSSLIDGNEFFIYLKDEKSKTGTSMRIFGLWGFSEAILKYRSVCDIKNNGDKE